MKIKVIKTYNLVNADGAHLRLRLGRELGENGAAWINGEDHGWRWSFVGTKIPIPVRSGYWFNGFPENKMLDWLKGAGWHLRCIVDMVDGKAKVFDLPEAPDAPEVPNTPATETDWIPVSSGRYPIEGKCVQVTFIDYNDGVTRHCDGMAFREGNSWLWAVCEDPVLCTITAWRPIGTPYKGDATAKATEIHIDF